MDKDRMMDTRRSGRARTEGLAIPDVCAFGAGAAPENSRIPHARGIVHGVPHGAGHPHALPTSHPHAHGAQELGQSLARHAAPALARRAGREIVQELRGNIQEVVQENVQGALLDVFEDVFPKIAALVGEGFERTAFREEMTRYLAEQGVPREAMAAMSRAYELELATKAMLFDKMQTARAEADAKLDGIPAVHAPRRASLPEVDGKRRARAALKKNPNSTEALAALFAEM